MVVRAMISCLATAATMRCWVGLAMNKAVMATICCMAAMVMIMLYGGAGADALLGGFGDDLYNNISAANGWTPSMMA